jgi:uncharacterized protein (TIGR00369 family)
MSEQAPASGDERVQRARERWDSHPLHKFFDVHLEDLQTGYARCRMNMAEHNRGGVHGAAHGGVLAFLCDVAALAAVSTVLEATDRASGTAELNISYLSPAVGSVVADARVLRKGRSLVVSDIDLTDDGGKLLAKSRVSYALRVSRSSETPAGAGPSPSNGDKP